MAQKVEDYLAEKEKAGILDTQVGMHAAYLHLVEEFLEYNENSNPKHRLHGQKLEEKLTELMDGLTRYYRYGDPYQEDLIALNVEAARETLLMEAFMVALDQPEDKKLPNVEAVRARLNEVLSVMFPYQEEGQPKLSLPESADLTAVLAATRANAPTEDAARENTKQELRDSIYALFTKLAKEKTLVLPKLIPNGDSIKAFKDFRKLQTEAINDYATALEAMQTRVKTAAPDNRPLLRLLDDRITEVEAFRNGYLQQLPQQDSRLTAITLNGSAHHLNDLAAPFQNFDRIHPRISALYHLQEGLQTLVGTLGRQSYRDDPPSVEILESGKKSWKSAIRKLINEKGCDWSKVKDISRVNVTFHRAETLFHFNETLRRMAAEKHQENSDRWEIHGPDYEPYGFNDRGIFFPPTGMMLWLMHFKSDHPEKGIPWPVEVKLDDATQRKVEYATHKIYECTRLLEGKNNKINYKTLSEENYHKFLAETLHTLEILQNVSLRDATPEIQKMAEDLAMKAALQQDVESPDIDAIKTGARELHGQLTDLHVALCCDAAKQASPSMQALYCVSALKALDELQTDLKDTHRQDNKKMSELQEKLVRLSETLEKFGP